MPILLYGLAGGMPSYQFTKCDFSSLHSGFRGTKPPRRQKSPFVLLNYSFTAANDASLYPPVYSMLIYSS